MKLTMDCEQARKELSNYLEGEVTAEVREAIDRHLAHCRCCRVIFDTTRRTLRIVSDAGPFEIPLEASARLRARLAELYSAP
jgi:predicted anti-sigma-YlaC factor YlaD